MEDFLVDPGSQYLTAMIQTLKYYLLLLFAQENLFSLIEKKEKKQNVGSNLPTIAQGQKREATEKNMTKGRNTQ